MSERDGQSRGWRNVEVDFRPSKGELLEIGFFSAVLGMLVLPKIYREIKRLAVKRDVGGKNPRVDPKRSGLE